MPKKRILRKRKKSGYTYGQIRRLMKRGRSLGPGFFEETIQLQEAWLNNDITYLQAVKEIRRIRKSQKRAKRRQR